MIDDLFSILPLYFFGSTMRIEVSTILVFAVSLLILLPCEGNVIIDNDDEDNDAIHSRDLSSRRLASPKKGKHNHYNGSARALGSGNQMTGKDIWNIIGIGLDNTNHNAISLTDENQPHRGRNGGGGKKRGKKSSKKRSKKDFPAPSFQPIILSPRPTTLVPHISFPISSPEMSLSPIVSPIFSSFPMPGPATSLEPTRFLTIQPIFEGDDDDDNPTSNKPIITSPSTSPPTKSRISHLSNDDPSILSKFRV